MSSAMINGDQENLTNAYIDFGRFHVIKLINEVVDMVRKEEVKVNLLLKGS